MNVLNRPTGVFNSMHTGDFPAISSTEPGATAVMMHGHDTSICKEIVLECFFVLMSK